MKFLIFWGWLFAMAAVYALPLSSDFTQTDALKAWHQVDSGYYQPLGKMSSSPEGLLLESNAKTVLFLSTVDTFPAAPGDKISITMKFSCTKDTLVYLGLFEFQNKSWKKNDVEGFWVKPAMTEVTKVITVKPGHNINRAALTFGIGSNKTLLVKSITAEAAGCDAKFFAKADLPANLVLHLDGAHRNSLGVDNNGDVILWRDLSGHGNDVRVPAGKPGAKILASGLNQLPMVRFSGKENFVTAKPVKLDGATVFMLFRREAGQVGGESWQDGLYWGEGKVPDNTGLTHLTLGVSTKEEFPQIYRNSSDTKGVNKIWVGSNGGFRGFIRGDVAEILVFNGSNMSYADTEKVNNYLLKKWNFSEDDYVRFGTLPPAPKRISHDLPLSDQENKGKWRKIADKSDEFNGNAIDRNKWTDQVFYTLGPAPVRTLPDNTFVKDGMAHIVTRYDANMPSGRLEPRGPEYHSFSNGMLQSVFMFRYGYLEARLKIQACSFNNAFWMIGRGIEKKTGRDFVPEIDIFELSGKSFAHTYSYNMALHNVQHKPVYNHDHFGRNWKSDFKFTDDFHVYGLEWTPKVIRFYIDGIRVREFKVKNNFWELPMTVHFNSLPHFGWFGVPDPKDFPATFSIDYFRLWKNPETDMPDDWDKDFKITHMTKTTGFSYDYYRKHGKAIVPNKKSEKKYESVSLNLMDNPDAAKSWVAFFGARSKFTGNGTEFFFPAVGARKDNGEVQYAAPSAQWPRLDLPCGILKMTDWAPYEYLAVDFTNRNEGVQVCSLRVTLESGQMFNQEILMKSGQGTVYWKLPDPFKKSQVRDLNVNVRGSDRPVCVIINNLRLEK